MAYKCISGADSYDPYLSGTDGLFQKIVQIDCSADGEGTYNYTKPDRFNDATNYDLILTAGIPVTRVIPQGTVIYQGSKGSTTALTAGLINVTFISEL